MGWGEGAWGHEVRTIPQLRGGTLNNAYIMILSEIKKKKNTPICEEKANQKEKSISLKQNKLFTRGRSPAIDLLVL